MCGGVQRLEYNFLNLRDLRWVRFLSKPVDYRRILRFMQISDGEMDYQVAVVVEEVWEDESYKISLNKPKAQVWFSSDEKRTIAVSRPDSQVVSVQGANILNFKSDYEKGDSSLRAQGVKEQYYNSNVDKHKGKGEGKFENLKSTLEPPFKVTGLDLNAFQHSRTDAIIRGIWGNLVKSDKSSILSKCLSSTFGRCRKKSRGNWVFSY